MVLPMIDAHSTAPAGAGLLEGLPAGFVQAQSGDAESAPFDLAELVPEALLAPLPEAELEALPQMLNGEPGTQVEAPVESVEQFLNLMLAQQGATLQARDPAQLSQAPELSSPRLNAQLAMLPAERGPVVATLPESTSTSAPTSASLPRAALDGLAQTSAPTAVSSVLSAEAVAALVGERSPATSEGVDAGASPAPVLSGVSAAAAGAPVSRPLSLQGSPAQWGEQMLHSLREHVEMQVNQRIQNATIRLDPPELGSLEIFLSHESGRLNVQVSAANADVLRLLQQTSDRLRHELVGQNFVEVNVQVSADAQGGRQQRQGAQAARLEDEPVREAQTEAQDSERVQSDSTGTVLVTV